MHAGQSPGFVVMGADTLETFAAPTRHALYPDTPNPPPVAMDDRPGGGIPPLVAPIADQLRHITAEPRFDQRDQGRTTVIPHILDSRRRRSWPAPPLLRPARQR